MKIVVNHCYGGFSLSSEAVIRLIERKSSLIKTSPAEEWLGDIISMDWKEIKLRDDFTTNALIRDVLLKDDIIYQDIARDYEKRSHPDLIALVEELGPNINGRFAKLEIVEIPDGLNWIIDDYDGMETIHEAHRSW